MLTVLVCNKICPRISVFYAKLGIVGDVGSFQNVATFSELLESSLCHDHFLSSWHLQALTCISGGLQDIQLTFDVVRNFKLQNMSLTHLSMTPKFGEKHLANGLLLGLPL